MYDYIGKNSKEQAETAFAEPGPSELSRMQTDDNSGHSSSTNFCVLDPSGVVSCTNILMSSVRESPLTSTPLKSHRKTLEKIDRVHNIIKSSLVNAESSSSSVTENNNEIIEQLKHKFSTEFDNSEKIRILTILPKSWSIRKICREFKSSYHMARRTSVSGRVRVWSAKVCAVCWRGKRVVRVGVKGSV